MHPSCSPGTGAECSIERATAFDDDAAAAGVRYAVIMKVGYHTDETLDHIIERKRAEDAVGPFFWGYGGSVCHPTRQVQAFVRGASGHGAKAFLLMSLTPSRHASPAFLSTQWSADNRLWRPIPPYARITGSRYALVCRHLHRTDWTVDLSRFVVGVGPKAGTAVSAYLRGRVDKACVRYGPPTDQKVQVSVPLHVAYVAELVEPYAVFLRSGETNEHVAQCV